MGFFFYFIFFYLILNIVCFELTRKGGISRWNFRGFFFSRVFWRESESESDRFNFTK